MSGQRGSITSRDDQRRPSSLYWVIWSIMQAPVRCQPTGPVGDLLKAASGRRKQHRIVILPFRIDRAVDGFISALTSVLPLAHPSGRKGTDHHVVTIWIPKGELHRCRVRVSVRLFLEPSYMRVPS